MKKHCKCITANRVPKLAQTVPGTTGLGVKLQMVEMAIDTAFVVGRGKFMSGAM